MPTAQAQWNIEEVMTDRTSCEVVKCVKLRFVWAFRPVYFQLHPPRLHFLLHLAAPWASSQHNFQEPTAVMRVKREHNLALSSIVGMTRQSVTSMQSSCDQQFTRTKRTVMRHRPSH